jgi:WD40 repeat protein
MLIAAVLPLVTLPTAAFADLPRSTTAQTAPVAPTVPALPVIQPKSWSSSRLIRTIREPASVSVSPSRIAISPDGSKVAAALTEEARDIRVWDINTGQTLYTLTGHTQFISAIAFSPNGQVLATADYHYENRLLTIYLWDAATGRRIQTLVRGLSPKFYNNSSTFYHAPVIAFSPDSQTLYSTAVTPIIQQWDVNRGTLTRNIVVYPEVTRDMQVSPDGRMLASTHVGGRLTLFDLQAGRLIQTFSTSNTDAFDVAFSPDGQRVMAVFDVALANRSHVREIGIWNIQTGEKIRTIDGFQDESWLVFSPDGRTFADGIYDGGIRLRDLETNAVVRELQARSVNFTFSPDGQTFAASGPQNVRIWR